MERADRLTDLIIKQKQHQITPDEFKAYRDDLIAGRKQRGKSSDVERSDGRSVKYGPWTVEGFMKLASFDDRLTDEQRRQLATYIMAVLQERGPNGSPVGFLDNGDKVEWLSSDEEEIANGAEDHWPLLLLRNEDEIHAASEEFFEKVWWNRHQIWLEKIADGKDAISEDLKGILETAKAAAKRIEEKYGRENLGWGDFEWGMVNGKLSALRWVTGSEWDFLDT